MRNHPGSLGANPATKSPLRNFAAAHRRTARKLPGDTREKPACSLQPQARATKKFHVERFVNRNSPTSATNLGKPQSMDSKEAPGWPTRE